MIEISEGKITVLVSYLLFS